ncbi:MULTISPECIES: hypothetical protein [unclassified Mesorhizobium]|uniref:hypothetical protein n=1 Tax=unclassified Mesorhizobium TaxID=325217 RepID=UPI0011271C5C|nr:MULTISPECIES: hypothetical protein [unclassified Mesorhizobium]MBZ9743338.1 hypothetical protein [Mesorhizobium sp. CO1-1-4]MBZ9803924.1 hypothetical protein [Mesorhizobium sp. ES1-6]TPL95478.1 hypothetical protein FJ948_03450 [Mesorhizobium sp. B2-3-12]
MSDISAGFLGVVAGLLVAMFGNVVVLPYVLRQQGQKLSANYRAPIFSWDRQQVASLTRAAYRFLMPILFGFVGAVTAIQVFGGAE